MRQIDPEGQAQFNVPPIERHAVYRLGRALGDLLHAPRAWLNQQLALARLGMRAGDTTAFMREYRRQFPGRDGALVERTAAGQAVSKAS